MDVVRKCKLMKIMNRKCTKLYIKINYCSANLNFCFLTKSVASLSAVRDSSICKIG